MPVIGRGGSSPPSDTNPFPTTIGYLGLNPDPPFGRVVGQMQAKLAVHLGTIGRVLLGQGCGHVAE